MEKEMVIKTGTHKCLNGETFNYEVTNFDMKRREFTSNAEMIEKLQKGKISPLEISRLLFNLYGIQ